MQKRNRVVTAQAGASHDVIESEHKLRPQQYPRLEVVHECFEVPADTESSCLEDASFLCRYGL
jgi:hypothetical protein